MASIWKIKIASNEINKKTVIETVKRSQKKRKAILKNDRKGISKNRKVKIDTKEKKVRIRLICLSSMLIFYIRKSKIKANYHLQHK